MRDKLIHDYVGVSLEVVYRTVKQDIPSLRPKLVDMLVKVQAEEAKIEQKPLSKLKKVMTSFPQMLINVDVKSKPPLETIPEVKTAIRQVEKESNGKGRVLVRYSGTQPQCRVMVESLNTEDTLYFCDKIAKVVKEAIGS